MNDPDSAATMLEFIIGGSETDGRRNFCNFMLSMAALLAELIEV